MLCFTLLSGLNSKLNAPYTFKVKSQKAKTFYFQPAQDLSCLFYKDIYKAEALSYLHGLLHHFGIELSRSHHQAHDETAQVLGELRFQVRHEVLQRAGYNNLISTSGHGTRRDAAVRRTTHPAQQRFEDLPDLLPLSVAPVGNDVNDGVLVRS